MKKLLKTFKPFDYIFIILALTLSFIPNIWTIMAYNQPEEVDKYAVIRIDGQVVDEFPLTEDGEDFTKTYYPHDGQYNIVEVDGLNARIKEDNSPDQIGVMTGWITRPGQTAICLPHGLVIEIVGQTAEEDELVLPL
ncbi:NusG domain II-containing protein [Eremococcus coleocola]|uniref:Uncharacterized protein n=1 Tax=Eremococcus coleocola ACS-139-V-Col8 TaxID=908337 RepID=E4KQ69_9LACT|nr:NusG domain II-containing protein [Eremococcus coleocola]EFR30920.1 hypothetical protein HMPREF9257_1668 [Eremococcus coleocola ACS-139-V-Col8]